MSDRTLSRVGRFQNIKFGRGFIVIPEKLIFDVFHRSWRGPWERFGTVLDAFWGPERVPGSVLATPWTPFGVLWGSQGRPGEVLGVPRRV